MKKVRFNFIGFLAIAIALILVSHCNSKLVEEHKQTELEKKLNEFQEQPYLKLNTTSPVGVIVTSSPERTEEPISYSNHK